jgi:putative FmdB family regulatory protein
VPIYEYRCDACAHQEDHLQKISEPQLTVCPACGKPTYKKQLSAAGFQLKGSGWYATDFKHSGAKPADKAAAKPETGTEAKAGDAKNEAAPSSGEKSDAKPAASAASAASPASTADTKASAPTAAKPAASGS